VRALLPCALVFPGSTPGRDARSPPAPALRGCQITFIRSHRYKLMNDKYANSWLHNEFIYYFKILLGIKLFYIILSFHIFIHEIQFF
jgi:hypothetical protein